VYLSWYDPDKKTPAAHKLASAIERYVEKHGHAPAVCLTNPTDAAELGADQESTTVVVRVVGYIPRHTLYVGVEEEL